MVLGKLAIVIGSGIAGSVLMGGESGLPDFKDMLSGALKFVTKGAKQGKDGPSTSTSSPHTAQLLTQVNHLREELQMLSNSKNIAIVTVDGRPGPGAYGITAIVVGAIGYLFIRWKGWKLSDMMFVTKRGLSDACNVVGKQVDQVSESVNAARRHLAGRIDRVDCSLDECQEIAEATQKEVSVIQGDLKAFEKDMQSVHLVVRSLETKLGRLAYSQVASSSPLAAIESPEISRAASLPPVLETESPSAVSPRTEAAKVVVVRSSTTMSASGLNMLVGASVPPRREHPGVFSRASSMKEGPSELPRGAPSLTEPSGRKPGSSSLFGALGFLRSTTS
ncbi:hypothetical protein PR202_gb26766 [Eleusine coracana subsp. coracana]|uniref:DUF1664 domain-containing protein n=1 Tax=Eleusine coracana subsp. coracana TaxID=191504 RepID=A0AAV5FSK9_ELECO|nr:hypothetical protein PR202_gb26766 [Eleusine coracana subsp. coracana]